MKLLLSQLIILVFCQCALAQELPKEAYILPETVSSLKLTAYRNTTAICSGTGFIIKSKTSFYLITNWHVVTNKSASTKKWLSNTQLEPNRIAIRHNSHEIGKHITIYEELTNANGQRHFDEFKFGDTLADVISLRLKNIADPQLELFPVDYNQLADSVYVSPSQQVFIVGFPLGYTSQMELPIWKTATIASEPDINQENKPIVWLDGVGYQGMSGSPVYLKADILNYRKGGFLRPMNSKSLFLGIYSHIYPKIGLGALWSVRYLKTVFSQLP